MSIEKAVACIKKHNKFLITAHTHLEGDALGSELAFLKLLRLMGKQGVIVNDDSIPRRYSFLPGVDKVVRFDKKAREIEFDCFSILDCSDLGRCGQVRSIDMKKKPILNIDHHISNIKFGQANWVEPYASSCSEMIYKLYKRLGIPFDREAALLLYVGILTDTGSFRYTNTTSYAHQAAAELLKHNIQVNKIYKCIYEDIAVGEFGLLIKVLPKIKFLCNGRIAWFQIQKDLLRSKTLSMDLTESVLNFARAIKGVEVAAGFKENQGEHNEIRINLRSQGKIDVNKIAKFFGGGGHKTASGCTVKGALSSVRLKVLNRIKASL